MSNKTELDLDAERASFEVAMNAARFFPAELNFARTKSPSGRDEYVNSHLESCWVGWLAARRATIQPTAAEPLPEMDSMADIEHAFNTPEDWDDDYRSIWKKLQLESRNKMQWRAYALRLRAAPADAVRDVERLDFMASEECQIESLTLASGTRYRVHWPNLAEAQVDWFKTPREAIDAAIRALKSTPKEPAK
jgi:hypothetical protein